MRRLAKGSGEGASSGSHVSQRGIRVPRGGSRQVECIFGMLCFVVLLLGVCGSDSVELPPVPDRTLINDEELAKFGINDEQRLFRHILADYDISVRPVFNASKIVNVFMGLTLTHIFNLDERNQVMDLNVWVEQSWHDERIRWDLEDFGNISKLTVGVNYVWKPDIVLYNNARDFARGFADTNLHITNDGFVQWAPPAKVHSICKMRTDFFPFDDQFCVLEFGSWIYDSSQLDIQIVERYDGKAPFTIDSFTENGEWEIVANRTRKLMRGRNSIYPVIVFELHLRRRVLYFLYNIIVPCIMLSLLTMMQFMLPCESGEKITLGLTVLLAYSVFSFNIAESMPETSDAIPLIAIYLMTIMAISALSVCMSVGVLHLRHGAEQKMKVPLVLDFIAFGILAKIFGGGRDGEKTLLPRPNGCLPTENSCGEFMHKNLVERLDAEEELEAAMKHWSQLSNIFDRFFFFCILMLTCATTVVLLLLCPRFSQRSFDQVALDT